MSTVTDVVIGVVGGIGGATAAWFAYFAAQRANRTTAEAAERQVDAEAYIRAKELYESTIRIINEESDRQTLRHNQAVAQVTEEAGRLRIEVTSLHLEVGRLRSEVTQLHHENERLSSELAIYKSS